MQHGEWTDQDGLVLNVTHLDGLGNMPVVDIRDYVGDLVNKTLRVAVVLVSIVTVIGTWVHLCYNSISINRRFNLLSSRYKSRFSFAH